MSKFSSARAWCYVSNNTNQKVKIMNNDQSIRMHNYEKTAHEPLNTPNVESGV